MIKNRHYQLIMAPFGDELDSVSEFLPRVPSSARQRALKRKPTYHVKQRHIKQEVHVERSKIRRSRIQRRIKKVKL